LWGIRTGNKRLAKAHKTYKHPPSPPKHRKSGAFSFAEIEAARICIVENNAGIRYEAGTPWCKAP
jgi:hypothetical protein